VQRKHRSVSEVFVEQAARHNFYVGVAEDGTKLARIVELKFPRPSGRYQIQTTSDYVDVVKIELFTELWVEKISVQPSVLSYADGRQEFAQVVEYPIDLPEGKVLLSFVRDRASGAVTPYVRRAAE